MNTAPYIGNFRLKCKHNPLPRLVFDALNKIGIRCAPYYVVLEGLFGETIPKLEHGFEEFETVFLESDDMEAVAALPGRRPSKEKLVQRLEEGQVCHGVKYNGKPVAFNWFDLKEFNYYKHCFSLEETEAYLFDAYTDIELRGRGLAPYVRYQTYKELERKGRTRLYSVSDYFNVPSIKFKKKLNAKFISLHLRLFLFGKWYFQILEKQYFQ